MNHRDAETRRAELNRLSGRVIGLCIDVHRELGPGQLEPAYEGALEDGVHRVVCGELFRNTTQSSHPVV